jgi:hypothetical protein
MAGSRVLIPQVRRLATLLATAAIATALAGVAPAVAGGKLMPATPAQRSAAAANSQVAEALAANPGSRRISATSVLLAPGVIMTVPGPVSADATMTVPTQNGGQMRVAAALPRQLLPVWISLPVAARLPQRQPGRRRTAVLLLPHRVPGQLQHQRGQQLARRHLLDLEQPDRRGAVGLL